MLHLHVEFINELLRHLRAIYDLFTVQCKSDHRLILRKGEPPPSRCLDPRRRDTARRAAEHPSANLFDA